MIESLDTRARRHGFRSLAALARSCGVPYRRLWGAEILRPDEIGRIEEALAAAGQKKTAAGTTRAAVKGAVGVGDELQPTG
jgi:hypothetical protein